MIVFLTLCSVRTQSQHIAMEFKSQYLKKKKKKKWQEDRGEPGPQSKTLSQKQIYFLPHRNFWFSETPGMIKLEYHSFACFPTLYPQ
jgi:hypothetical protein